MRRSFYRAFGTSNYYTWNKATSKTGEAIRIVWRKNLNDPGEPLGVVLCAVLSFWLPVSHQNLFDFLRDEGRRNEWEIIVNEGSGRKLGERAGHGNAITIQAMKQKEKSVDAPRQLRMPTSDGYYTTFTDINEALQWRLL